MWNNAFGGKILPHLIFLTIIPNQIKSSLVFAYPKDPFYIPGTKIKKVKNSKFY